MFRKFVLVLPAAALTALSLAGGLVATSSDAEAGNCRRVGPGRYDFNCQQMSTPKPDKPNQKRN